MVTNFMLFACKKGNKIESRITLHNFYYDGDKKALHAWACRADDSCVLPAFMRYQSGERP